jgi:hypothetical protein
VSRGRSILIAVALLLSAVPCLAQGARGGAAFESLSLADQKIAHALFLAQIASADGPAPLSLNQIAMLKGADGWRRVLARMRSEGLVQAQTLGQVVSAAARQPPDDAIPGDEVVLTQGSGRSLVIATGRGAK